MADIDMLSSQTVSHYRILEERLGGGADGLLLLALTTAMKRIPLKGQEE